MTQRHQLIDTLRGFAMIVMILTHVTAYFPGDKIAFALWNWSHFAVPIFVFCSVYLFIKKFEDKSLSVIPFLKKRFVRLLIPYYLFLGCFIPALLIVTPEKVTTDYLWKSIIVIGGVDINWLVLLFLCLTVILPFFLWSYRKATVLFWLFFAASFGSTLFFLFQHVPFSYKWIMWLPWSFVLFFTWFYIRYENKKNVLGWSLLVFLGIFFLSYALQVAQHHSTVLIHNKYPPNIMYLSFGITVLLVLHFIEKYLFRQKLILLTVNFFSKYSYSIYFLHYLVLIVFATYLKTLFLNWITFFLIVFLITVLIQYVYNSFVKKYGKNTIISS